MILDLILEPVIHKYFIQYESFPFLCEHTIGGLENLGKVFQLWHFYYDKYSTAINNAKLI